MPRKTKSKTTKSGVREPDAAHDPTHEAVKLRHGSK